MTNNTTYGHIAAFLTILIWGTTFVSTKILLTVFTPLEILFIRFSIGYLALWLVCPRKMIVLDKKHEYYFAAAGLFGITLYYLFENIALTYTLASNVGVISSIVPFFTVIFTCLFLKEQLPSWRFFLGFVIAISGICLLSFGSISTLQLNPLGDILAVTATMIWAAYATLTKKIGGFGYNVIQVTRRIFFYGLLFMIPALWALDFQLNLAKFQNTTMLFNLLFLGFGASALCFVTWNFAVSALGAVKTSIYIYMVPVITTVTSALILQEKLTPAIIGGIALTLAGLFLSEKK